MMRTFWCLLSLAVIGARAESTKSPDVIYMDCVLDRAMNCSRPGQGENSTTTVRPEVKCREVIEDKRCVEKICGPMPESMLKEAEMELIERNITCDIRGSGGNNSTVNGSGGNNSTGTGSGGNNSTGTGSGGNNFSDIGSVGAGSSGCADIKIDLSLAATYISFLTIIYFI